MSLHTLVKIDPAAVVLDRLDSIAFLVPPGTRDTVRNRGRDRPGLRPTRRRLGGGRVDRRARSRGPACWWTSSDALPDSQRVPKLAVLDRAALQARASTRIPHKALPDGRGR